MATAPLTKFLDGLTERERECVTHGMNFQMYIMDIRREIAKCGHKGEPVDFHCMVHRDFVLDLIDWFKEHVTELSVNWESVPEEQGEPYCTDYRIVSFKLSS